MTPTSGFVERRGRLAALLDDVLRREELERMAGGAEFIASLAEGWLEDDRVECPLHAAQFCLRTGEALCLPATKGVGVHRVEEREGQLYLVPGA